MGHARRRAGLAPAFAAALPPLWTLLVAAAMAAPADRACAGPAPPPARTFKLANGLSVALAPDSSATTVDVALWFPAGTRFEHAGQSGITHLFDGLLFAGTPRHPAGDHLRLIQREGGDVTAFSTPDFSCVDDNVPPQALELALRLEADRMANLVVSARTLEVARAALRREHQTSDERSALGASLRQLYRTAFAGHPYHHAALGEEADLVRLTLPVVQAWWRDHYGPAGTWLTIAGRFDPDSAAALARRTLGAVPRRGVPPRIDASSLAAPVAERRGSGNVQAQVPILLVGWRTPPEGDPDAPALDVLDHLLTRGGPLGLENVLVTDTSACLAIQAALDLRRDGGLFYVAAAIRPTVDSTQAESEIERSVERLTREPLSTEALEGAIRRAELETLFAWQTSRGAGRALGLSVLTGGPDSESQRLARLSQLTPVSIQEVAARTFTPAHRVVVWMYPAPPPDLSAPAPKPRPRATPARKKAGR